MGRQAKLKAGRREQLLRSITMDEVLRETMRLAQGKPPFGKDHQQKKRSKIARRMIPMMVAMDIDVAGYSTPS